MLSRRSFPSRWFRRSRLQVTPLESRLAPATFIVFNNLNSGAGSLRQAVLDANTTPGTDTINIEITGTINLTTQLLITEEVNINGLGADKITVKQTGANQRVFDISGPPTSARVAVKHLTITGGNGVDGGAFRVNNTHLLAQNCVIEGNSGPNGGGVAVLGTNGRVSLNTTIIRNNTATISGGAVHATGGAFVGLYYGTMSGNKAPNGGGMFIDAGGDVQIGWSSVYNNSADFDGGAINVQAPAGVDGTTINNSTLSNNKASRFGGAAFVLDFAGPGQITVPFLSCTIVNNSATTSGGGVFLAGAKVALESTVLGNNKAPEGPDASVLGQLSAKSSALGTAPTIPPGDPSWVYTDLGNNLPIGIDLKLSNLGPNGGDTWSHLPKWGSPLIDAGTNAGSSPIDQRLVPRESNGIADIGAVEVQQLIVTTTADSGMGSLREAITSSNSLPGPEVIHFLQAVFNGPRTIELTSALPAITGSVEIVGTGVEQLTVRRMAGAAAFRVFTISNQLTSATEISDMTISNGINLASGGGIFVGLNGNLLLTRVAVSGNQASFDGGGIAAGDNSHLTITDSTIGGNSAGKGATDDGGGIFSTGLAVTLIRSTMSGNMAAMGRGGGVAMATSDGYVAFIDSTISGNSATGGGGVFLDLLSRVYVWNSTVTNNTASTGVGGGVNRISSSAAIFDVFNSIVSGNIGAMAPDISASGTIDVSYSAIGKSDGFSFLGSKNLAFDTNLELGPLAPNGGVTQTHLPTFDSPLFNSGKDASGGSFGFDQRGNPRQVGSAVDIGAVEIGKFIVTNADNAGTGSLRDALTSANQFVGKDQIEFDPTFFGTKRTITLTTGQLEITDLVTVVGPGQALLTISGNLASRVMHINGPGNLVVNLSGLTIANGKVIGEGGGALIEDEHVTFTDCTINNNEASQDGGGIEMNTSGGQLTLLRCSVSNNSALSPSFDGGGIDTEATGIIVMIIDSTISGNKAGGEGGGVFIANGSWLDMRNCTVMNNHSTGSSGGGVYVDSPTGLSLIANSTFTGNTAMFNGGAMFIAGTSALMFVYNSTIVGNSANFKAGGIALNGASSKLDLRSSVVAGNTAVDGSDINSPAQVTVQASLLGTTTGIVNLIPDVTTTGLVGLDPQLGPLANNGGLTQTFLPRPSSPLLDMGKNSGLTFDQRGLPRVSFGIDIGAVELQQIVVTNSDNTGAGSLRAAMTTANSQVGPDWIRFDADFFSTARTISLASALPTLIESAFVTGPGANLLTVQRDGAAGSFAMFATTNAGAQIELSGVRISGGQNNADGGAIRVGLSSHLILDGVLLRDNKAMVTAGGAIDVAALGQLTIRNSTLANNQAVTSGGAIRFRGALLLIENSTISGNQAGANGGAIDVNSAGVQSVIIRNSTITNNTAANGGGLARNAGSLVTIDIDSTIVSGNTASIGPDIYADGGVAVDHSAIGSASGFTLAGANNLAFGLDLRLTLFMNLGGATAVHALLPGSPALDAGSNPANLLYDQRGPGFVREQLASPDIGAYEAQPAAPPILVAIIINDGAVQRSRVTKLEVQFDQLVSLPANSGNAFTLRRQSDGSGVVLTGVTSHASNGTKAILTFSGSTTQFGSLTDGRYNLNILASQITGIGGMFDGNGDGTGGDNQLIAGSPANGLFRLFGDADGNGTVNTTDFNAFRSAFGGSNPIFDFDNAGGVGTSDFNQFRQRFGASV